MTPPPPPALPPEVLQAVQAGQTIEAIRLLRASTGMDVRQAQALILAAQASAGGGQSGSRPPSHGHRPVEEPRWRSRPGGIVILLVVLALLGWWISLRP
jgi:hypothetical protein